MKNNMLLVAIGCGRLPGILDIIKAQSFVVFGSMDKKPLAHFSKSPDSAADSPVFFYETGWIVPRRVVAVGSLQKIWLEIPQDVSEEKYKKSFEACFGAEWDKILDAIDSSFEYNAYNTIYFSVGDIKLIENLNIDQLLEEKGLLQPPNVVVG